jgi:hypothetical protein
VQRPQGERTSAILEEKQMPVELVWSKEKEEEKLKSEMEGG